MTQPDFYEVARTLELIKGDKPNGTARSARTYRGNRRNELRALRGLRFWRFGGLYQLHSGAIVRQMPRIAPGNAPTRA